MLYNSSAIERKSIKSTTVMMECDKHALGSYRNYYKRNQNGKQRIELFNKAWFYKKICLDIGCNEGIVTSAIAEMFRPSSIRGIDVDHVLIEAANSIIKRANLASKESNKNPSTSNLFADSSSSSLLVSTKQGSNSHHVKSPFVPRIIAAKMTQSSMPASSSQSSSSKQQNKFIQVTTPNYPSNLSFTCIDVFKLLQSSYENSYDTILCLSTTKWIHLNHGDDGIIMLFQSLFRLTRPSGHVILEYQPWKSYRNKKSLNDVIKQIFPTIKLRPEYFEDILEGIGFVIEERLGVHLEEAKGYNRPILVLKKPLLPVNAISNSKLSVIDVNNFFTSSKEPKYDNLASNAIGLSTQTASDDSEYEGSPGNALPHKRIHIDTKSVTLSVCSTLNHEHNQSHSSNFAAKYVSPKSLPDFNLHSTDQLNDGTKKAKNHIYFD